MQTKNTNTFMQNKQIFLIALATGLILLLPLVAMQFTDAVAWDAADFAVAGVLLFGTGLAYVLAARRAANGAYRAAVGVALAAALLLVWMNLAVGIIGSEDNPANLMYFGVLAVGTIGVLIVQFRPEGMARALFATALAHALVTVIALIVEQYQGIFEILFINGFFIALWIVSALLFRRGIDNQP
jgi:hypothetical protein